MNKQNITSTTNSTSYSTGSSIISGGIGIAKDLYVGGTIYGNINGSITTQNLHLTSTTNSTSMSTGSLIVDGGTGITKDLYVGGTIYGNISGSISTDALHLTSTTNSTSISTGALIVDGGIGITKDAYIGGNMNITGTLTVPNIVYEQYEVIQSTTNSTSATTGASIVNGGVGIAKDLYVGGTIYGNINGSITTQNLHLTSTTNSTSISTGALIVDGGAGIVGDIYGKSIRLNNITNQITLESLSGATTLFRSDDSGYLNITPSGSKTNFTGAIAATGAITGASGSFTGNLNCAGILASTAGSLRSTNSSNQLILYYTGATQNTIIGTSSLGFCSIVPSGSRTDLTGDLVATGIVSCAQGVFTRTSSQIAAKYDASNYTTFQTSNSGNLTITPTGGNLYVTGNLQPTTFSLSTSVARTLDITNFLQRTTESPGDTNSPRYMAEETPVSTSFMQWNFYHNSPTAYTQTLACNFRLPSDWVVGTNITFYVVGHAYDTPASDQGVRLYLDYRVTTITGAVSTDGGVSTLPKTFNVSSTQSYRVRNSLNMGTVDLSGVAGATPIVAIAFKRGAGNAADTYIGRWMLDSLLMVYQSSTIGGLVA